MSGDPGTRDTLPGFLRNHDTRIERLERRPRGNGLPAGGSAGQVVGYDVEGNAAWVDPLPPGGNDGDVLTRRQIGEESSNLVATWQGPIWWAWVGTEEAYNALGEWDDQVLYVIVKEIPGSVTDVTPEDLSHTP